ncbi:hypothetical protein PENTCL1PPCAC_2043, partial [Pristionchus entomophagus]
AHFRKAMGENVEVAAVPPVQNGGFPAVPTMMVPDFVAMPLLQQTGDVFVGPGAKKEAQLLGLGLKKLRTRDKDEVAAAKRYCLDLSIKQVMQKQQQSHQQNQQKQAMYSQALSLMGRVYIGSISFEVRESDLKKAFENFGPVKAINMSYDNSTGNHKGFAFLEFEIPEAAVIAQDAMNGLMMGGRNLKVGRPANMPQAQPIIDMIMTEATKYHRVYVASVHPDLSETDLKSVFEAFGEVTKCQLARNNATNKGVHRGFGYIEFSTRQASQEAIAGMNMFDLGGQFLRVGKCITPPEALNYLMPQTSSVLPSAAAMAAASITAKIQATEMMQKPTAQANARNSAQNSPGNNSPGYATAAPHQSIGVDPVNGLYITSGLPTGPSPCLALTNQTNPIPSHLAAVAVTPAQAMLGGGTQSAIEPPPPPPPVPMDMSSPQKFNPVPPPLLGGFNGSPVPPVPPPSSLPLPSLMSVSVPFPGAMPPPPPPPPNGTPTHIAPEPSLDPSPSSRRGGFGGFADVPPIAGVSSPGVAPAPSLIDPLTGKTVEPPKPKVQKQKKEKRSDMSILDRIKLQTVDMHAKATFGPVDDGFVPKEEEKEGEQLALMGSKQGDVHAMALALLDGNKALVQAMKRKEEKAREEEEGTAKKKKKIKAPKAQTGPKLNTAAALAAAVTAGQMSDAIINTAAASDDATLHSQETISIRGNDARHLLMTKLMRVNRSSVVLLKNMVTPDDIDEFLEGEIREECGKFGAVSEVVIASDPVAGSAKVFVRFSDPIEAEAAKQSLDKRFFAGRSIIATIYDQAMFEHNDLSG